MASLAVLEIQSDSLPPEQLGCVLVMVEMTSAATASASSWCALSGVFPDEGPPSPPAKVPLVMRGSRQRCSRREQVSPGEIVDVVD